MNHDNNNEMELHGEPELEARLVAWVAGELPDFEQAELEKLVAARPELANFKRRLELVRELVQEAEKPEAEPLRLSAERRAKLLKTLGADPQVLPLREQVVVLPPKKAWWRTRAAQVSLTLGSMAAGGMVALLVTSLQTPVYVEEAQVKFKKSEGDATAMTMVDGEYLRTASAPQPVEVVRAYEGEKRREGATVMLGNVGERAAAPPMSADEARAKDIGIAYRRALREPTRPTPMATSAAPQAPVPAPAMVDAATVEVTPAEAMAKAAREEPVRMDAFTVEADRGVGYTAASSMNAAPLASPFKTPPISLNFTNVASQPAAGVDAGSVVAGTDLSSAPVAASAGTRTMVSSDGRTFILANGNISVTSAGGSNVINTSGGLYTSTIQGTTDFNFSGLGMLSSDSAGTPAPTRGMEFGKSDAMNVEVSDKKVLVWDRGSFNLAGGETYHFAGPGGPSDLSVRDARVVAGNVSGGAVDASYGRVQTAEATALGRNSVTVPGGGNATFAAGSINSGIIDTGLGGFRPGGAVGAGGSGVVALNAIQGDITIIEDGDLRVGSIISGAAAAQTARFGSVIEDTATTGASWAGVQSASNSSVGAINEGTFVTQNGGNLPALGPAPSSGASAGNLGATPPLQLGDSLTLGAREQVAMQAAPAPAAAEPDGAIVLNAFSISAEPRKAASAVRGRAMVNLAPAPQAEPPLTVALPAITLPSGKGETVTAQEAVSTFSLHVSDVSFRLAQSTLAAMTRGEKPPEPTIRAEEIYNAMDYDDPYPTEREKVRARIEQSAHPLLQQRNLVRIALRVAATGRVAQQPLRLTILLDTSGSMEREDRRQAVRQALGRLMALLGPQDRVTLIGFARQPRLLAENVAGGPQAADLVRLAAETPPDGGTNLEAALTLARELAVRHRTAGAQNRIVLLTDGAANLGDADPARLGTSVEALRQAGISFDACGVGLEGTGDAVLESLTRRGDGRYYVLDRAEAADAAFAAKIAGALRPAAENVKVQVRFNPARVGRYRLIGFEKRRLATQDFRNDQVNAAELSAEEAAVAMYQVEALPEGTGDLGEVSVRFRDPATGEMVERTWTIPHEPQAPAFARATPSMQLAGFAAMLAEVLSESPVGEQVELTQLAPTANRLRTMYPQKTRVAELLTMYEQMRRLEKR